VLDAKLFNLRPKAFEVRRNIGSRPCPRKREQNLMNEIDRRCCTFDVEKN
jgi:hypothetical protein